MDRKSILIDQPSRPYQVITNLDMNLITENMIIDLFDRNLFYPPAETILPKAKSQVGEFIP